MSSANTAEVMERGMSCLLEKLGVVDTERFISVIIREKYDYTKWRRSFFGDATVEDINKEAVAYAESNPFIPKKPQISV